MRQSLILISFLTCAFFSNAQTPSKKAKKYIEKVFALIEKNYFYIDSINIPLLKEKCNALISNANTINDTYPAIDTLLKYLFDHHHIFIKPLQFSNLTYFEPLVYPTAKLLDKSIGYVKIPSTIGHYNEWQWWSDSLQNSIARIQTPEIKGWIIDLRGNKGGDLTPMITSVKPFFGDTTIFTLKDRNNKLTTYKFSNGFYILEKNSKSTKLLAYKSGIENVKNIPVAILIDTKSASSAEMVAIAFKGRTRTIFLGEPTAGLTICTNGFTLSDNAFFTIATGKFYDTKGNSYEHSITPDIFIRQEINSADETKQKAIEWILKQ